MKTEAMSNFAIPLEIDCLYYLLSGFDIELRTLKHQQTRSTGGLLLFYILLFNSTGRILSLLFILYNSGVQIQEHDILIGCSLSLIASC